MVGSGKAYVCGSLESGDGFCVGAFGKKSGFSRQESVCTYNLVKMRFINFKLSMRFENKYYAEVNCITVQHKTVHFR
jgi:hypothetical protein